MAESGACCRFRLTREVLGDNSRQPRFIETERTGTKGSLPFVLLERAGLVQLRGDADGLARDLAEARRLFAEMGTTGWDEYARSIEE